MATMTRRAALLSLLGSVTLLAACSPSTTSAPVAPTQPAAASGNAGGAAKLTAAPAASSGGFAAIEAAAKQEKQLVLNMIAGTDTSAFTDKLQKALPWVDLKFDGQVPSKMAPQVLAEQQNGQYNWDLHLGPTTNMVTVLAPANALEPIEPYLNALEPDKVQPDKWAGGFKLLANPEKGTTLITQYQLTGGIWANRAKAPKAEAPGADAVIDPKYRGKITVYNPVVANGASQTLAALYNLKGEAYVRKLLLEQEPVIASNQHDIATWVAEGRYLFGAYIAADDLNQLKTQGLSKDVEVLDNTQYVQVSGVSVFKNPPHPNVVKAVLNWFFSQEGQDAWASSVAGGSTRRTDVKAYNPSEQADATKLSNYGFVAGVTEKQEALQKVLEIAKQR